jgi:hypothetical protein
MRRVKKMNDIRKYIQGQIEYYDGLIVELETESLLLSQKIELYKEKREDYQIIVDKMSAEEESKSK